MLRLLLLLALAATAPAVPASSRPPVPGAAGGGGVVLLTLEEALKLAFPDGKVERKVHYLTPEQKKRAARLAGEEIRGGMAVAYIGHSRKDGSLLGVAWFDTHKIRTKRETIMVVVGPDGKVRRLEVLAFGEPEEYLPAGRWLAQFQGRGLDDRLKIRGDIRGISGATLTAQAVTSAVRRVLALHTVLQGTPSS